ncbi:hypothetical protein SAMN05216388_10556 [Halorientalis persicus]|uniref:Uncharacterized protein n=1 Tax=Halorientalis persicus TaxID=1367881 RepID=A0A1H8WCY2_9EURY|nr:hypothetical protein [Halorientalis persicus]SEP25363.1 hypothetical protein SAMN05216388_10556 [Halorientalis persicus]
MHREPVTQEPVDDNRYGLQGGQCQQHGLTLRSLHCKAESELYHTERRYLGYTRWVGSGDVAGYIEEHGTRVWEIPDSYSSFYEEFDRWCHRAHGTLTQYGYGISARAVEIALRAVAGKGRYTAADYDLVVCDDAPALLLGPTGTVLIKPHPINRPALDSQRAAQDVQVPGGTITVEEDQPEVLAGIERVAALFADHLDIEITGHQSPSRSGTSDHTFAVSEFTADGRTVSTLNIEASTLATVGELAQEPTAVPVHDGGVVDAYVGDDQYYADWDGPAEDATVGAVDEYGRLLVGWQFEWRSTSSRSPSRDQACVRTYFLRFKMGPTPEFQLDSQYTDLETTPVPDDAGRDG